MMRDRGCRQCSAVVLLYHRLGEIGPDPWALTVSPEHFEEHLQELATHDLVPLAHVFEMAAGQAPLSSAVAITFDDGYAETAAIARPLLEQYGAPATFFVPTGTIGSPSEFWWDELQALVLEPSWLPDYLGLELPGGRLEVVLLPDGESESVSPVLWRAWHDSQPTPRHTLYKALWERCHSLPARERDQIVDSVRAWAGRRLPARDSHRCMTPGEIQTLAAHQLFDLGAHSVTHGSLAALPIDLQTREIYDSRTALEEIAGETIDSFAYPYGKAIDYTDETVELVKNAGFKGACLNVAHSVTAGSDLFRLPRVFVENWSGDELRRRLKDYGCD